MQEAGIAVIPHTAKHITRENYERFDCIIGMDEKNINELKKLFQGLKRGTDYCGRLISVKDYFSAGINLAARPKNGNAYYECF